MVHVQEIYDALKPAYIYCKIFAICPYTIRGRGKRRNFVFLKRDAIILIVQILLIVQNCYDFVLTLVYNDNRAKDIIDNIAFFFPNVAFCFGLLLNMMFFHIHRKYIVEIIIKLDEIDTILSSIGCGVDYNVIYKKGIAYLTVALFLGFCMVAGDIYYCGISMIYKTCLPILVEIGIRAVLYVFLFDAQYKFSLINNKLSNLSHNKPPTNQHISIIEDESLLVNESQMKQKNKEMAELLQKIVNIHGKLSIYCNQINYLFHTYLILTLSTCFMETITTIYDRLNNLEWDVIQALFNTYWTLYHICVVLYMVYNFNNTSSEVSSWDHNCNVINLY